MFGLPLLNLLWDWFRKAMENPIWVDAAYLNAGFLYPSEITSVNLFKNESPFSVGHRKISFFKCPYRIEEMTTADYDRVVALWEKTEGVSLSEADRRNPLEFFLQRNPRLNLVAKGSDGSILGVLLCGQDGRRGYIYHLAVIPRCRRRGIARALVEACLSRLHGLGIEECNVLVFSHLRGALRFWHSRGWKERKDLQVLSRETAPRSFLHAEMGEREFSSR